MFDWQQLKRWSIDEDTLPPGSIVRYKNLTIWDLYRWYIIAGIFLFLIQGFFIFSLAAQRRRERRAHEILAKSREFNRAILMSMKDHIAVLDKAGIILLVNQSWLEFARENDASSQDLVGEGISYLEACRRASGDSDETAQRALRGIKTVLGGSKAHFELEYPCHSPTEQRWYLMRVIPFRGEKGGVVISHADISEQKKWKMSLKPKTLCWRRPKGLHV